MARDATAPARRPAVGSAPADAGHDVTHWVRPGTAIETPTKIAMCLLDERSAPPRERRFEYPVTVVERPATDVDYDVVLVSVKHYDVPGVLPMLASCGDADVLFFNNWWQDLQVIDAVLPRNRYMWGFPVAGGGWIDGVLDGALLDGVHLGEIDGRNSARLERIEALFASAGLEVERQRDEGGFGREVGPQLHRRTGVGAHLPGCCCDGARARRTDSPLGGARPGGRGLGARRGGSSR